MKLQGRNLSLRMQGEDVKLLHTELGLICSTIPDNEIREATFGPTTEGKKGDSLLKFGRAVARAERRFHS